MQGSNSSILQKEHNFIRLYQYLQGESEVPEVYHFWAALSLLASSLEDRVWFVKHKHEKLFPNLYVILVGPSGLGKGSTIGPMVRLADNAVMVNKYRGRITAQRLLDKLGKPVYDQLGQKVIANPKLWLIMDELRNDVSPNPRLVEDFMLLMTEIYTASGYVLHEGTRTHGEVKIANPLINWFAGVTDSDLQKLLTPGLLESGFTARICFVFGEYDFDKRVPELTYPHDYDQVFYHLSLRLWALQKVRGEMVMDEEAREYTRAWYMGRPKPDDKLLYSAWKRQHDMLLKFSMILCMADGQGMEIKHRHVRWAKKIAENVYAYSKCLVSCGIETNEMRVVGEVKLYFKQKGAVAYEEAIKYWKKKRSIKVRDFRRVVEELCAEGVIVQEHPPEKGCKLWYRWVDGGLG